MQGLICVELSCPHFILGGEGGGGGGSEGGEREGHSRLPALYSDGLRLLEIIQRGVGFDKFCRPDVCCIVSTVKYTFYEEECKMELRNEVFKVQFF